MDIREKYDKIQEFRDGVAGVKKGKAWGYIDKWENLITPIEYRYVKPFEFGIGIIEKFGNPSYEGAVNREGEIVIPFKFDSLMMISENYISASSTSKGKNRKGVINHKGQIIIPLEFSTVIHQIKDGHYKGCFWATKFIDDEFLHGIISLTGLELYPFIIEEIRFTSQGGLPTLYKDASKYSDKDLSNMGIKRKKMGGFKNWFSKF